MKQIKKVLVAVALVVGMSNAVQAQESKVAHINTQELVEAMPSYKAALADLEKLQSSYDSQISDCLLYTSPSPRDRQKSRMPSSA